MAIRISRKRLEEIAPTLTDRDHEVLSSIRRCRYITTGQVGRLHFTGSAATRSMLKAAMRNLNKLKALGLIDSLERRIGGVRAGSGSLVWRLESGGEQLLRMTDGEAFPHRKRFVPSVYFLAHTLAVTECSVQLMEICKHSGMKLMEVKNEPDCWRSYNGGGRIVSLKPDLFAVTRCGGYEDRWFFEIDLATESPVKVIEKCRRYMAYYRGGLEQKQHDVFPLVVWIVPDEAREVGIRQHIQTEFSKLPHIFEVITPEKLENLICQGADQMEGGQL